MPEMGTSGTIVAAQGDCAVQEGRRRVHEESSTYQDLGRGVGRKQMQGGREPRRSVYTVRRILAALIVLLLLVLLVPQACQALLGTGSESGSGAPDTADVDGSGSEEEDAVTVEETAGDTELAGQESTEEGSAAESSSEDEQANSVANASEDSGEDEDVQNVEFDAALAQVDVELDAAVDGGVNQIAPVPVVDLALQQEIQPIALGEPVVFEQPIVTQSPVPLEPSPLEPPVIPAQPIIEQPILPEEPAFFGQPIPFEEPVFFEEEPAFFAEPAFYWEEPIFFEEPVVYDAGAPTVAAPTVETEVVQESAGEMQEGSSEASTVAIASGGGDRD